MANVQTPDQISPAAAGRTATVVRAATTARFFAVLLLLVVLFVYFSASQDTFLTSDNINNLLTSVAILFIVSIGLTFVMLGGGFDLSLGPMLALTGIALSKFFAGGSTPLWVAIVLTLLLGAALGSLNGVLIGRLGLSFLVVTLGTFSLFRGSLNIWSDAKTEAVISPTLDSLAFDHVLGIPIPVLIMAGILLVAHFVLRRTYFGRDVYAVGGNAEAARLSGISVARTLILVYAIAGTLVAVAGILQVSRVGAASPSVGDTIVFDAAAAVLLGGTSFAGGIGGVAGTAVGVLFLGVLQNGLSLAGVASYWQQVITGAILLLAILLDKFQREGWPRALRFRRRSGGTPAVVE